MKKWVCRLSIVCCLCLFFTSVKAQLSLGGLGDILNSSTVNKVVSAIAGTDASLTVADLAGTWKYSAPACKFESSDFLKSAGGEVVAASLKTKLATYYTKAGITPSRVSFAFADTTFVMKYGNAKLNGHIVKDEESGRFRDLHIGKIECRIGQSETERILDLCTGFVISTISHHDTFGKIHLFGPIIVIAVVTGIIFPSFFKCYREFSRRVVLSE